MSIPNDLSTYETMNNMKNMLGGSFIEYLKPNIKTKQNENVLKMLEIAKDKPETYLELLAVAIFHQNFEVIKYMVEKFKIMEVDCPYMKASSFYNSILPDDSKDKINDGKDYIDIQVPFVLMSGIGGDVQIFKYLLSHKLISKKNQTGIIGLSKKFKNTFTSNIVGACAYYGKSELLESVLKSYKELDVNVVTTEKKSKNTKYNIPKEFAGCTPALLAMAGPSSDEKTLEILKILKNHGANFEANDFNKDNLLHIATKNRKINSAKYLLDELILKNLVNESNKDGYTPFTLAQHLNDDAFISYYSEKNKIDEKEIEENLKELILDSDNKVKQSKKSKKNKKKAKNEPTLLNTSEYQESLKVEKKTDEESNNSSKLHDLLDNQKSKKKKEKKNNDDNDKNKRDEKEDIEEKEEDNSEDKEDDTKEKESKNSKNYENRKNSQTIQSTQNNTNDDDEPIIGLGKKGKKNKRGRGGNRNKANDGSSNTNKNENQNKEKKEDEKEEDKESNELGESNKEEKKEKKKSKKEKRVDQDEIDKEKKRKKEELEKKRKEEEEERRKKEEEDEKMRLEQEREEQRKREEEEKERQREEEQRKKEEQQRKKEEQRRKREEKRKREEEQKRREEEQRKREEEQRRREEEEERKRKEEEEERKRKEEEERRKKEEEEEKTEKEDLSYSEEDNVEENSSEKEDDNNVVYNEKDYQQLNKNYLELEKKMENLEKEKEELTSCLTKLYLENKNNSKNATTSNTEENINDLLYLANKELENKNNIINDLEEKMAMLDLTNIKNFSNEKLQKYKDFYTKNLNLIKDALK